jgi:hypothetical protein
VPSSDLHIPQVHSGIQHGRHEVCRSMCGCIRGSRTPAASANRRSDGHRRARECQADRGMSGRMHPPSEGTGGGQPGGRGAWRARLRRLLVPCPSERAPTAAGWVMMA